MHEVIENSGSTAMRCNRAAGPAPTPWLCCANAAAPARVPLKTARAAATSRRASKLGHALLAPRPSGHALPTTGTVPPEIIRHAFGVELETKMAVPEARHALDSTQVPQQKPDAADHTGWKVVNDGGAEFVSPILGVNSYHQVGDVLAAIGAAGGHVKGDTQRPAYSPGRQQAHRRQSPAHY